MSPELPAFLVLLALSLAVPIILFLLLRVSLRDLLQQTVKLQAGVTFYLRSLPSRSLFIRSLSRYWNVFRPEVRLSLHGIRVERSGGSVINPGEVALVCCHVRGSYHYSRRHAEAQR
jgi:hypothetical protein